MVYELQHAVAIVTEGTPHGSLMGPMRGNRQLQEQEQEVDPGWFGSKLMRGFQSQTDPRQRLLAAREARPHATINAQTMSALRRAQAAGDIRIWEGWEVHTADLCTSAPESAASTLRERSNVGPAPQTDNALPSSQCSSSAGQNVEAGRTLAASANVDTATQYPGRPPAAREETGQAQAAGSPPEPQTDHTGVQGGSASKNMQTSAAHPEHSSCPRGNAHEHAAARDELRREAQGTAAAADSCWRLQLEKCRSKPSSHQHDQVSTGPSGPQHAHWEPARCCPAEKCLAMIE